MRTEGHRLDASEAALIGRVWTAPRAQDNHPSVAIPNQSICRTPIGRGQRRQALPKARERAPAGQGEDRTWWWPAGCPAGPV